MNRSDWQVPPLLDSYKKPHQASFPRVKLIKTMVLHKICINRWQVKDDSTEHLRMAGGRLEWIKTMVLIRERTCSSIGKSTARRARQAGLLSRVPWAPMQLNSVWLAARRTGARASVHSSPAIHTKTFYLVEACKYFSILLYIVYLYWWWKTIRA